MRHLLPLALALLAVPSVAQPPPEGSDRARPSPHTAKTHLYGELLGATFLGLSLNMEQPVAGPLAVRGGLGFMSGFFSDDVTTTLIAGLVAVPGGGTYRPELAATATVVMAEDRWVLFGPYLGVRYHARNGSVFRLGNHFLLQHGEGDWNGGLWPAVSFGGRL